MRLRLSLVLVTLASLAACGHTPTAPEAPSGASVRPAVPVLDSTAEADSLYRGGIMIGSGT